MPPTASRHTIVADDLRERGFTIEPREWATIARGDPTPLTGVDAPPALISLRNTRPLTVVSEIANATDDGYVPVLVADPHTAESIEPILSDPFLLAGQQEDGREFFSLEGRIELSDGSYACVETDGHFEWYESGAETTDSPELLLDVGGEAVTVLDSVEDLTCPGPAASSFQYSYARGEDGQFRVFEDGAVVSQYTGIGAIQDDGFRPVPYPLVPEDHIRHNGRLARATMVATVTGGQAVTYRSVSER